MKSKSFTIRLDQNDIYKLDKISELRAETLNQNNYIKLNESWTEIIRHAIYRFYNETIEYYMYEKEMYIKSDKT